MSWGEWTQYSNQEYFAAGASWFMELGRFLLDTVNLNFTRMGARDTHQTLLDTEASKSLRTESISAGQEE